MVTWHVADPAPVSVCGVQDKAVTAVSLPVGSRVRVVEAPTDEVIRIGVEDVTAAAAFALKIAVVTPVGMLTETGMVTRLELEVSETITPGAEAGEPRLMVQLAVAGATNADGAQLSDT